MKRIIKTKGTVFSTSTALPEYVKPWNSKRAYIHYNIGRKSHTSKNMIQVPITCRVGSRINVWYVDKKPHKVYRYKISAMILG